MMSKITFRIWHKHSKFFMDYNDVYMDCDGEVWEITEESWAYQNYMRKINITEDVEIIWEVKEND